MWDRVKKYVHAALIALAHLVTLLVAHHFAEHAGTEVMALVRDEWLVGITDKVAEFALGE